MHTETASVDFLSGDGEMAARMRAFDWNNSLLGSSEYWPQSLRLTVRLLLNSRQPMFIWWGPELIQFYNDAYKATMGPERHPSALGARGRECWSEIWPIIGPQVDFVMAGHGATWDEDRLVPVTRHGSQQKVWWSYGYNPIDLDGKVGGVLVICADVTAQHLATDAFKDQARHLRHLFEQSPGFVAILRGPEHIFEITNGAYRKLVNQRDCIGKSAKDVVPEAEGQGFFELLDAVYSTGKPHVGKRTPFALDDPSRLRYLDFMYAPILDEEGRISGIFVEGVDVTEHINNEDHLRLINDELKHRVKNTLAVVSAMAWQSFRGTSDTASLQKFLGRLGAFAKAHESLTENTWATANIRDVVEGALAPHRSGEGCFSYGGPDINLGSKQALSLALVVHELATNAIKYGALSRPGGRVKVSWSEQSTGDIGFFVFSWKECGGPAVSVPTRIGFGSRLIKQVMATDFGGTAEFLYEKKGMICRLTSPMKMLGDQDLLLISPDALSKISAVALPAING